MGRRLLFCVFITSCLVISLGACGSVGKAKPAKEARKPAVAEPSSVEWKERQWENYAEDRGGVLFYFERESVTYPSKDIIHVWRKRVFPGRSSSQKEIVSLDEINCKTEKYRSLELQGVNWDDTTTVIYKRPTPWNTIYTDTADEYFLDNFCRRTPQ